MHFLLQTPEDITSILGEAAVTGKGHAARQIVSHEQLEVHATESGMVMVFIGKLDGPEHAEERRQVGSFAQAAEAALSGELKALTDGYRLLIREAVPGGRNLAVKAALNRVRVQEKFLAGLDMADQTDACELLRLSKANPSATLKRIEDRGGLIRIDRDGRPFYPLFQFDVENGRIHPGVIEIIRLRPEHWSNIRLCYWMTRKHTDFNRAPADLLGQADEEVIAAFRRDAEPELHG